MSCSARFVSSSSALVSILIQELPRAVRPMTLTLCIVLGFAFLPVRAQGSAGDLDINFGVGGKVTTDFTSGSDPAYALAIQADGKIVVAGATGFGDFALSRYNPDGSLDTTFDGDGKVTTDIGVFDEAFGLAIQSNGRIVAAGSTAPQGYCCQFALARYNSDGSLDTSFDGDGELTTPFGGDSGAYAVAIQSDGKIVAAGQTYDPFRSGFALARYNPDGSLDMTFGTGGKVITTPLGPASSLAVQSDGKIVVVGAGFTVARYNPDGTLDTSFAGDGTLTTDFGGYTWAQDVAIQADGKIVVAGVGGERFALARYNPDGSMDTSFDDDGMVTTRFFGENIESAQGVAIQADGKIVAAGSALLNYDSAFAIARYNSDGSLDTSFGEDGKVTTDFDGDRSEDAASGIAAQADGNIVAVGSGGPCIPPCYFALARYLGNSAAPLEARLSLDPNVINLKSGALWLTAYIELVGFDPASIDATTLRLAGSVPPIPKVSSVGDHDGDQIPDFKVKFSRETLDPLLVPGVNQLEITGSLVTGEEFKGSDEIRVIDPPGARLSASAAPNPLNPTGILTVRTERQGPLTVSMFDLQGRLVRRLLDRQNVGPGIHEVGIDGRGRRGETLASGVYLYRVETTEGMLTGRVVILK